MTVVQAVILGLIQGLTEFLPVSSSGHLVIAQAVLGIEGPALSFDVMVHFGTLIAVLAALKDDWVPIVYGVLGDPDHAAAGRRRLGLLVVGSIPVGIVGLLLKDRIEVLFSSPALAGWMLLVTGLILMVADRAASRTDADGDSGLDAISVGDALIVGIAQVFALLPGLSRSGVTIGSGLMKGLGRETAARFAFLLAIPAIAGATLLELPTLFRSPGVELLPIAVGTVVAGVSGYGAVTLFLRMIRRRSLWGFALYTWVVGLAVIALTRA